MRPCLVVSPDELNQHLRTATVAPMTTGGQAYPWRVPCRFQNRSGFVTLDQLRTVDEERLVAVARGEADEEAGRTIPHEQVDAELRRKWLIGRAG